MAVGTLHVTVPAVAAAIGIYFFERNQSKTNHSSGGIQASIERLVLQAKEEMNMLQKPKVAPQFDGLHCFETLVVH